MKVIKLKLFALVFSFLLLWGCAQTMFTNIAAIDDEKFLVIEWYKLFINESKAYECKLVDKTLKCKELEIEKEES